MHRACIIVMLPVMMAVLEIKIVSNLVIYSIFIIPGISFMEREMLLIQRGREQKWLLTTS